MKAENDALIGAINASDKTDEDAVIEMFKLLRMDRKQIMLNNGYPEELIRYCDVRELLST